MSKIRECFKSRWEDGYLVEVDYSQLEIIALAALSGDENLIEDLLSGKDLHTSRAAELFKIPEKEVTKAQRRYAKTWSFMLQYGAGAKSMAESEGMPIETAKQFIANYYERYPKVKEWQDYVIKSVTENRTKDGDKKTSSGKPRHKGEFVSITGRRYMFLTYDNKYYNKHRAGSEETQFSATQMKNWPCQGFATADIMKIALGILSTKLWGNTRMLMVNTVHDSIVFDVADKEALIDLLDITVESMLDQTTDVLKRRYGIDLPVPLSMEIKYGKNWDDMSVIKLDRDGDFMI